MGTKSAPTGCAGGKALTKRKPFALKTAQYIRVESAYISAHSCKQSMSVVWDADLSGCTVTSVSELFNSLIINLRDDSPVYVTLDKNDQNVKEWAAVLRKASKISFDNDYVLGEEIGSGAFASVHKAIATDTGEEVAVKVIIKQQFDIRSARELEREMLACRSIHLPGVVDTRGVYQTKLKVFIVMDFLPGGTLKQLVENAGDRLDEVAVSQIVHTTLSTLNSMHDAGFVHRDIKLENILCTKESLPSDTVLCDLGYVQVIDPGAETMRSRVGTLVYIAPEIVRKEQYGAGVDLWSVGVMAYRLICGSYPFNRGYDDDDGTLDSIVSDEVCFSEKEWAAASPACISLIRGLLQKIPAERLTAKTALEQEWMETAANRKSLQEMTKSPRSVLKSTKSDENQSSLSGPSTITEMETKRARAVVAIGDRLASQLSELLNNPDSNSQQDCQTSSEEQQFAQQKRMADHVRDIIQLNAGELAIIESATNFGSPVGSQKSSADLKPANSGTDSPKLTETADGTDAADSEAESRQSQPLLTGTGQKSSRTASIRRFLSTSLSSPRAVRGRTSHKSGNPGSFSNFGSVFGRRKNQEEI